VRIRFTDGSVEECFKPVSGGIITPLPSDEVVAKYRTLTHDIVEPARIAKIEDRVLHLQGMRNVKELIALLAAPVQPIFL
jgi:hypothetical protein